MPLAESDAAPARLEDGAGSAASRSAEQLIERAQAGHAPEALVLVELEIAGASPSPHPALFFARAVIHDVLGDRVRSAGSAGEGVEAAERAGSGGWRAACLAMRALQLVIGGEVGPEAYDEAQVLRDLAQAQVALSANAESAADRIAAYCNLAQAYTRLRLYEMAVPMYLETAPTAAGTMPPEARVVQQLNLSTLHLTWALELHQVGLVHEADAHSAEALERALEAEWSAAGPHRDVWAERARLFAACARTLGPDPLAGVSQVRRSLAALEPVGADYERAFSAPVLGLALAAAGLLVEGLLVVGQALAAAGPGADPVVLASTQRAQLVLMSSTSEGARAGLDLAETLSSALWRQRARRLSAAEALLRYEILQAEHEIVSRDSDVDALTGTAARRALDRRMATLSGRSDEERASVCVLVIDLDGLKTVNDSLGHLAGDLVLSVVGQALTGSLRGEDLVGRFGGDEFVALLCTEARDGAAVATRMLAAVRKVAWPDEFTVRPSMSIGLAVADADVRLDDALAAADGAMYLAKRSGGDTLRVADPRG